MLFVLVLPFCQIDRDFRIAISVFGQYLVYRFWSLIKPQVARCHEPRCASMRTTTAKTTCLSYHCLKKNDISMALGVNLMEVTSQKATDMYIEAAVREWLMPAPSQCGRHFTIAPPVTAHAILGWQTLDLISGQLYQSFVTVSAPTAREHSVKKCPFPCQLPWTIFLQKDWLQIPIISQIPFVWRTDSTNCEAVPSVVEHIHWLLQVQILMVRIWWSIRE